MDSTVKARPNHYEILGVTPAATDEEIRRAFAREISALRPRAFGGVGEVSIAYETLRHPDRRKAYDSSIGIRPEPKPAPPAIAGVGGAQFIGATLGARLERLASENFRIGSPPVTSGAPEPDRAPSPPAEPRTASFIASSVRSNVKAAATADIPSPIVPRTDAPVERVRKAEAQQPVPARHEPVLEPAYPVAQDALNAEDASFDWKQPAAILGGLVLAVGLLGAWAGWEAGNDGKAEQPLKESVTQRLPPPPAFPVPEQATAAPQREVAAAATAAVPQPRAAAKVDEERKAASASQYVALAEEPAPAAGSADPLAPTSETASTEPEQAAVVPAMLPLPHSVVARTIGRIGYSCGQVASASAVDGKAGVFKVTCTSGDSYRAAPVRGRYRFSRWGKN
jgi:curved DNA-binding protein CbpA